MPSRQRSQPLHPLQHDRLILLACMSEILDLADSLTHPSQFNMRTNLVLESTRVGNRLLELQKRIEEEDID